MHTVTIQHECGCFKRSEFEAEKTFEKQQDAYNYSNMAAEIMNEDFCQKHHFFAQITEDNNFVICVGQGGSGGSCGTGASSCGTSCGC